MIDVVSIFKTAATAAGYEFVYGQIDMQNQELTRSATLSAGKSVLLLLPFIETAEVDNSIIHRWSVSTEVWLGKKFDVSVATGTYSQLDETDEQKYDRRLKVLRSAMETYLKTIFCADNGLELTNARMLRNINKFDENLDFISAEITFVYDS